MHISFKGRKVVVAGGSRGIGRSIALAFAAEGADVAICARDAQGLKAAEAELKWHGGMLVALLLALVAITYIPELTLWLPRTMGVAK
jgi:3-oxoacyl-[acyl-carrier protein] reductase